MSIQLKSKTILVVDDEPDICEALGMALQLEGYVVKAAPDRDEALRVIANENPAMILLDYRMPGLDAKEFVAQLQARKITAPVVLMTAGKDPSATARQLGLQHFLAKPFELDELLRMVKTCSSDLDGREGE